MRLIYPAEPFSFNSVDGVYADEFAEAKALGFDVSILSFEDFQEGYFKPRPAIFSGEEILFRCWMMQPDDYTQLCSAVSSHGGRTITDPSSYKLCHYLPEWYPHLREYTAETRFYPESADIISDLTAAQWDGCFLKDYVKSLNTDGGSLVRDLSLIPKVIANMRKYRGCIEGGLCVRRIEDYDPASERRFFVWRGIAYGDGDEVPELVQVAASRISSLFFTVDVARCIDGTLRVVELGDGQVSDRKHWSCNSLLTLLATP